MRNMNYKSASDLNTCIWNNMHKVPRDVDIVVGIPRSGMVPASLLALYLNKPLADLDGFLKGHVLSYGKRYGQTRRLTAGSYFKREKQKIILVDDSVSTGRSLTEAKEKIAKANISAEFLFLVVYADPSVFNKADIVLEINKKPRAFQWNMFHHRSINEAVLSFEGVLCKDSEEKDFKNIKESTNLHQRLLPFIVPSTEIGCLVSGLPKETKPNIESWLKYYGVRYRELLMLSPGEIQDSVQRARVKADIIKERMLEFYIEDRGNEAQSIAAASGKKIFSLEAQRFIYPYSPYQRGKIKSKEGIETFLTAIKNKTKKSRFGSFYRKVKRIVRS